MEKTDLAFEDFLHDVKPESHAFVTQLHVLLMENRCGIKIDMAKNGYVVSYAGPNKRVLANYVFRKSGLIIRIYGAAVNLYLDLLETLPEEMIKSIEKAPACRRLIDFTKCNSKCRMGYDFILKDTRYQKCQYNCFMFSVNPINSPFIKAFLESELDARLRAKPA